MRNLEFWESLGKVASPSQNQPAAKQTKVLTEAEIIKIKERRAKLAKKIIRKCVRYSFLLCIVIAAILVLNKTVFWTKNVDGVIYKRTNGYYAVVGYKGDSNSVIIKSTVGNKNITVIKDEAFANNETVKFVTIEDGIEYIGTPDLLDPNGAFANCPNLLSVNIPDSVHTISAYSFFGCERLNSVSITGDVNTIGAQAFENCSSLSFVTVSAKTLSNTQVQLLQKTFNGIVINFEIPYGTEAIMSNAFRDCTTITNIIIPDTVTVIGDSAFLGCKSLATIDIPVGVTKIGNSAFASCSSLKTISLPNTVQLLGDEVFYNCDSIKEIVIPNSVTDIGSFAFANCTALTTITLPENLEIIKSGTFYNCSSLVNLEIPYTVTSIEVRAFYKCSNLLYVTLGKKIEYIASSAFQLCQKLEEIYYEGKVSDWKAIDGYRYITKVSIVCYDNTFYLSN